MCCNTNIVLHIGKGCLGCCVLQCTKCIVTKREEAVEKIVLQVGWKTVLQ